MCHSWLWLKEVLLPPFLLLFQIEDRDAEYFSLVSSYQDKPLAGEDTESVENQLDVDGLFPRTLQVRYENAVTRNSW